MRTTIRLDDHLLAEVKKVAAETGRTITAVIEGALRESLGRRKAATARPRARLATFKGKGLRPGVDLDDSAALLDLLDGPR
jgi:predicted transcriptional regulator